MTDVDRPRILLGVTPLVERTIEALLFGDQAAVDVLASAAEADELDTLAASHDADAALVSPDLSGLSGAHCARAGAAGLRVIGVALDDIGRDALQALGVEHVLTPPLNGDALAGACRPAGAPAGNGRAPKPAAPNAEAGDDEDGAGGNVVAVLGSKGAPGSSELAASLAVLAAARWDTVLAEIDALAPSLDVRLGADPRNGSLAGLARAVEQDGGRVDDLLARWLHKQPGWPPVLLGAPDPSTDLARPGAAAGAVRRLAAGRLVVGDVGFPVDLDDAGPVARVHREVLAVADAIVLVLGARDVQLRHGLAQLAVLCDSLEIPAGRLRVVVNATGAPGAGPRVDVEAALLPRLAERGLTVDCWIPFDRRALVLAQRRGLPLASARPRGPYRRALTGLLDELFLPTAPVARARKQRLTPTTTAPASDHDGEEVAVPWHR